MTRYNPKFIDVDSLEDVQKEIKKIGSDPKSIDIMAPKAISKIIKLDGVILQDALIIKQDMLSIGGEVAIPRDAFELKEKRGDILIIGTIKQLRELINKLDRHYARIKDISKDLLFILDNIP